MSASEIIFDVAESADGGYEAQALGHSIFTRGEAGTISRAWPGRRCSATSTATRRPG